MGKKSSPPPAPDPNIGLAAQANLELAKTQREIAQRQLDLQQRQMDTADQQYADQKAQIDQALKTYEANLGKQNEMTDLVMNQARKAEADYDAIYRPNEQRLAADAAVAGGAGLQEEAAGRAGADLQRQIDMQREAQGRQMAQMGVNPNSGRFEANSRSDAIRAAAARAGAMTGARVAEVARGDALRTNVANFGRGIAGAASGNAGQAAGMTGASNATAGGGFNFNAANNAAMMGAFGQGMGGFSAASGTLGAAGNLNSNAASILNNQYQNQLAAWQQQQASKRAGIGGIAKLVGAGVGFMAGGPGGAMAGAKLGGSIFG